MPEQTVPARKDKLFVLSSVPSISVLTWKICCQRKMIATAFWGNLRCFCFLFCLLTSGLIVEVMDHVSETPLTPVMHQRCQQLHVKTLLPNAIPAPVDLLPFLGCVSRSSGCNRSLFLRPLLLVYLTLSALVPFSSGTGVEVRKRIWPVCKGLWEIKHLLSSAV